MILLKNCYLKKICGLFHKTEEKKLLDKIIKIIGKNYDSVFYLRAGLGESYVFYFMIEEYIKKYKFKKPCIICHRKFYNELSKMFAPNIPFYYIDIPQDILYETFKTRNIKYRGITFNVNPSTLYEILTVWENYRRGVEKRHYIEVLKELNGVFDINYKSPLITSQIKQSVMNKTKYLNKTNFIFLIPNANFFHLLSSTFWDAIEKSLKEKGYDIFVNSKELTIAEAYYLASLSKGIVGIRGGFSEVCSAINVPKHIIYTKNRARLEDSIKTFTLKEYPHVNKELIYEYECYTDDYTLVLEQILENLC